MDLERRVQMLEQEVEILKNQVQETLLDIKEKVLTQTYPSLRAESKTQPIESQQNGGHGRSAPMEDYPSEAPAVRQVSTRQPEANGQQHQHQRAQSKVVPLEVLSNAPRQHGSNALQPNPRAEVNWERMEALEQWTLNKIERIGVNRTYKLLKYYLEQGRVDRDTFDALVSVLKLYAKPRKPKAQAARQQPRQSSQQRKSSQRKPAQQARQRPDPRRQILDEEEDEDDGRQNLILRLIAGVSNASIGVSKSKKHG